MTATISTKHARLGPNAFFMAVAEEIDDQQQQGQAGSEMKRS